MVHSLRLHDMVATETARVETRALDFYAASEAAVQLAADFHSGFASASSTLLVWAIRRVRQL